MDMPSLGYYPALGLYLAGKSMRQTSKPVEKSFLAISLIDVDCEKFVEVSCHKVTSFKASPKDEPLLSGIQYMGYTWLGH